MRLSETNWEDSGNSTLINWRKCSKLCLIRANLRGPIGFSFKLMSHWIKQMRMEPLTPAHLFKWFQEKWMTFPLSPSQSTSFPMEILTKRLLIICLIRLKFRLLSNLWMKAGHLLSLFSLLKSSCSRLFKALPFNQIMEIWLITLEGINEVVLFQLISDPNKVSTTFPMLCLSMLWWGAEKIMKWRRKFIPRGLIT